jgi:hypothetical protein
MAGNVTFRILIASEGFERFDVIIRPLEPAAPAAGQLTLESDMESGFGKSAWPGQSQLWEQAAKSDKIIRSGE